GADPNNCGACGHVCVTPNATPACAMGACAIAQCAKGFADCDHTAASGCETPTESDPANCGGCGARCPTRPNTAPGCHNAMCAPACKTGFADCNQDLSDGCEVDLGGDAKNCGACGMACPAKQGCLAGRCSVAACGGQTLAFS